MSSGKFCNAMLVCAKEGLCCKVVEWSEVLRSFFLAVGGLINMHVEGFV